MTVSTQYQPFTFKPGAAMAAEAIPWQFLAGEQIVVTHIASVTAVETVLVLGDDYSIGGSGPDGTGSVTALAAWPVNDDWRIERGTSLEQEYELPPFEAIRSSALERENDRQLMALQEQVVARDALDARAVQVAKGVVAPSLPMGGTVGNKVVGWNAPGTALIPVTPGGADAALRDDLASELGGEFFTYNDGGAEAESISGRAKLSQWLHVEDRGVTALSSTATNFTKFTDIFGTPSRSRILLDGINYPIGANVLTFGLSNVWVKGVRGATKISGSAIGLMALGACSDVIFEDIIFECTSVVGADDYRGVMNMFHAFFERITFIRCKFTAPNCGINGVKIVVESIADPLVPAEGRAESIHFYECEISDVGRMGIEVQNNSHPFNNTQRYFDIVYEGGSIRRTGLEQPDGMGISLTGYGSDCKVDTLFDDTLYAAIECIGASSSKFTGRTQNLTRYCHPLAFTNALPMIDNTVYDFKTIDKAAGSVLLRTNDNMTLRNNTFWIEGYVDVTNMTNLKSFGDKYKGEHPIGIYLNGATEKCVWDGLDLDHSGAGGGAFASIRADNGANGNLFFNMKETRAPAGQFFDNNGGAFGNWSEQRRDTDGFLVQDAVINTVFAAFPADANAVVAEQFAPQQLEAETINITSGVALTAARQLALPQKVRGSKRIRNSTTGGQDIIIIADFGGSTVTIPTGQTKAITVISSGVVEV